MTNVFLQHNPFKVETQFRINGKGIHPESKLACYQHERLQMWLELLMPILVSECNDDLDIQFKGIQLDYDDFLLAVNEYKKKDKNTQISVAHIPSKAANDRLQDLVVLFDNLQKECPFEDLRDQQIRHNFYSAVGKEFEVSVIATMSSGKSTLINAMLGKELMPAKNEACTATIARIKDVDGKMDFSAVCKNIENQEVFKSEKITYEIMNEYNSNPQIAYIDIEGDIPFVSSKSVHLVLQDTPGPNNARTEEHKNHTYRVIKEKSMPMVLYVLNATQLSTNDDNFLLASVAEAMKVGGKQAKDRFVFAVNKIDTFDTEKGESIATALANVKEYLASHGIHNPNIYPTSAEMAKVIRLGYNAIELTKKQRQTRENYWAFNDDEQMHLSKYAPLSLRNKEKITDMLTHAVSRGNAYEEALIHSGIPAVEIAINEYLDKYALTNKIKTAVDTFIKKIHEKKLIDNLTKEIENNEKARERLNESLISIQTQLNDGKNATIFKDRIEKLDLKKEVDQKILKTRVKITKVLPPLTEADNIPMSPMEVEQFLTKLKREIENLQSDVKTDLEAMIQDIVVNNASVIHKEYLGYIQSLVENNALKGVAYHSNATLHILANETPSADELINQYKYKTAVKVGEKWVGNTSKKWYKPWTWFQESGRYESIFEDQDVVDRKKVYDALVMPIMMDFVENLENAKIAAKKEADNFKIFFLQEIDKLNSVLRNKVTELQAISESEKSVVARIKEDKEKNKWLDAFLQKLDTILEI